MRIVRRTVEPLPYGETAIEGRILLNRSETKLLHGWLWLADVWDDRVGWLRCRLLGQHNRSCRGIPGHVPSR